jgi:uncharacterized protein YidB (DUF937 family)
MLAIMQRWIRMPLQLWAQLANEEFARAVDDLVQRNGAVKGVIKRMEQLGLGTVAYSWISSEAREPIYSEQLHALFGTSVLRAMAAKLNLPPRDLVRHLSQALPRAIYRLAFSEDSTAHASLWTHSPQ